MHEAWVGLAKLNPEELKKKDLYADLDQVSTLVREAMIQVGLGQADPQAPLKDIIQPGASVLIKPNWVLHYNQAGLGMDCMVTHPAFILSALKEVLAARPGKVILGDAPLQGCEWDRLVTPEFVQAARQITGETPFEIVDFRRTVLHRGETDRAEKDLRPVDRYILFDLGKDSLLEPISKPSGRFRVTRYDPRLLSQTHQLGRHQYLLSRDVFEADVVLNLPKLKTHRKAGLTAALKNLVGINGNKDYLPHHRVGGSRLGGDCYQGLAPLKRIAEYCYDQSNQHINQPSDRTWRNRAEWALRLHRRLGGDIDVEGGWFGNDTVWRMSLDLNRALVYGCLDGSMADRPQRQVYSLTDAIVAGQGEGPLASEPLPLGVVTFAASSAAADEVHAALLGLDYRRIPLISHAFDPFRWPLVDFSGEMVRTVSQGKELSTFEVAKLFGERASVPRGWVGHCEIRPESARMK